MIFAALDFGAAAPAVAYLDKVRRMLTAPTAIDVVRRWNVLSPRWRAHEGKGVVHLPTGTMDTVDLLQNEAGYWVSFIQRGTPRNPGPLITATLTQTNVQVRNLLRELTFR